MKATPLEYRFRFAIHAVIYLLGFWAPWLLIPALANVPGSTTKSTWLILSSALARQGWLTFSAATIVLLVLAIILTSLGGWLRVWGAAFVGSSIVKSPAMHGASMLADGPFRRTRNPLYLGTILHTLGICILMPPSGALFTVSLLWIFQIRLALAEEPFLAARFGPPYLAYKVAVPRFLPSQKPLVPAAGIPAHWPQALLGEIYFVAIPLVLLVFGWSFNAQPLRQGLLIALGIWLILRAFLPKAPADAVVLPTHPSL